MLPLLPCSVYAAGAPAGVALAPAAVAGGGGCGGTGPVAGPLLLLPFFRAASSAVAAMFNVFLFFAFVTP